MSKPDRVIGDKGFGAGYSEWRGNGWPRGKGLFLRHPRAAITPRGVSGLDLAEEAAECGVPTIIMSGASDQRREVEACRVRFLAKPFDGKTLMATIGYLRAF